ncbi:16S rRNA (uracil1498-N3)-methyltransferase [Neolewinella xylanilytica]|uniref:Ribosomal RNA small subunit methyltransferase E n=1 Tax=Neolewinella xylanilytica TaxID=1514080 RepID=A0A2S6I5C1_9BACT|nr:RsmE family RNA methyltransferase [Neolewinella xylanilytica]PPK86329.1 16S rRNA (uracil1498-N3)-methyltransferase [Neolewinella xylanilytica]
MQLFFDPDIQPGLHELREAEAIHAARVLRKRVDDEIDIVDGLGGWFRARITAISKRGCTVDAREIRRESSRAPHRLSLWVAPTKSIDRFEFVLEKATEIGVDVIQPMFTEHSERNRLRTDRLARVIESAAKQSLKAWMPRLEEPLAFSDLLDSVTAAHRYLAYLGAETPVLLRDQPVPVASVVVAIGPEGGFSPAEADAARDRNFTWVSLGPHRLRTETAAITAVHTLESLGW